MHRRDESQGDRRRAAPVLHLGCELINATLHQAECYNGCPSNTDSVVAVCSVRT